MPDKDDILYNCVSMRQKIGLAKDAIANLDPIKDINSDVRGREINDHLASAYRELFDAGDSLEYNCSELLGKPWNELVNEAYAKFGRVK